MKFDKMPTEYLSLPSNIMFKDADIKIGDIIRVMKHSVTMYRVDGSTDLIGYDDSRNQKPHLVLTDPVPTKHNVADRNFIKFNVLDLQTGDTGEVILADIDFIQVVA